VCLYPLRLQQYRATIARNWSSTLQPLVLNLAATGSRPCRNWFSTLPQLVFDLVATGFRPCRNWFSTLQQLVFDLAATGFSTLQQLVFNLAATNSRPYRNWRLCCNTGYLGHGKYPSQLRSWCKNLRSLSNKMVA